MGQARYRALTHNKASQLLDAIDFVEMGQARYRALSESTVSRIVFFASGSK